MSPRPRVRRSARSRAPGEPAASMTTSAPSSAVASPTTAAASSGAIAWSPRRSASGAGAVRHRARADEPLPRLETLDVRTDLHDDTGELVPEDGRIVEARRHAVQREEIGSADRRPPDLDDRVRPVDDLRIGGVVDPHRPVAREDDRLHAGCSISTRYPSGSTQKKRDPPHGGEYGSARNGTPSVASSWCTASASSTSSTRTTFALDLSAGADIVTPGRSGAACPCSASEMRAPAARSVAYGGSS